jgi:hypothetical protein
MKAEQTEQANESGRDQVPSALSVSDHPIIEYWTNYLKEYAASRRMYQYGDDGQLLRILYPTRGCTLVDTGPYTIEELIAAGVVER